MDSTPTSKAMLFLTFQTDQNKHRGAIFHTVLRCLPTQAPSQPTRVSLTEEVNTQHTPSKVKNIFHTSLVFSQWRRRWSIDSSLSWHKKHLFVKVQSFFWTWSKVRTFPQDASQAKKLIFGCTLGFQTILTGKHTEESGLKLCKGT